MRVGVYNRWVDTLGGGEQTLGAFAATLATAHDVDLLVHDPPDWAGFQGTLGHDLSSLPTRLLPYDRDHQRAVQTASKDYDLFINCSYLEHVRAFARVNVLQVFFPPEPPPLVGPMPPPAAPPTRVPDLQAIAGLHQLEWDEAGLSAWTDGAARFALVGAGQEPMRLMLRLAGGRPPPHPRVAVRVELEGKLLTSVQLPARGYVDLDLTLPPELMSVRTPFLDVLSETFDPSVRGSDERTSLGVRLAAAAVAENRVGPAARGLRPGAGLARWTDSRRYRDEIAGYDLLLANSHFTQRWIARRCGRGSELLYPPVQIGQFRPGPKKQQIISVGRFFVAGHSKKQLAMIRLFRRLCDEGLTGWEYHLVGGTHDDPASAAYLESCYEAAHGYPVSLHVNAPLSTLRELYAESSLYWNATGYGEDPEITPDSFEHFGMTTVEAMASGCVPLSHNRAGQPEVIEHGVSGVLWETLDDLAAQTHALITDPERRRALAAAAVHRSGAFSFDRFRQTLLRLLADTDLPDL